MKKKPAEDEQQAAETSTDEVKQEYYVPAYGQVVTATSAAKAGAVAKAVDAKKQKDGDA